MRFCFSRSSSSMVNSMTRDRKRIRGDHAWNQPSYIRPPKFTGPNRNGLDDECREPSIGSSPGIETSFPFLPFFWWKKLVLFRLSFFFVHTTKERKKRRERLSSTSSMAVRFLWLGTTIYIYIRKDYNCTSKQTKIWPGPIDSLGSNYRTRFLLLLLEWAAVLLSVTYTIFQWNRATRATDSGGVATDLRPISIGPFWSLGWEWLRPSSVFNSCKT